MQGSLGEWEGAVSQGMLGCSLVALGHTGVAITGADTLSKPRRPPDTQLCLGNSASFHSYLASGFSCWEDLWLL